MTDHYHDIQESRVDQLADPLNWRTNARGNRWRLYQGWTLSVFSKYGGYRWCVSMGRDDCRFSKETFETPEEAMRDIAWTLVGDEE